MDDMVNSFNEFFVSVGPNLANKIPDPPETTEETNDNYSRMKKFGHP